MAEPISVFRSQALEVQYLRAYDAVLQQWPVPYAELDVPTRFGATHVIASGPADGHPVLLLPPGGTYAPIWVRNVGPLSQSFRVYAVDILGEVNKSKPTRPILNHAEFMQWMADLLDGLGIERAHLVGNSNGGFFALETALNLPERVDKVVLISPAATFVQMWAWWLHLFIPAHIFGSSFGSERMVLDAYDWLWQGFPMDDCFALLRRLNKLAGKDLRPSINRAVPRVFSDDELKRVQAPVLLLIGDHEVIYKPEDAFRRASRLLQDLKVKIVPNANHTAQYTSAEFVNTAIENYFLG
jgi:pimeloyl-ACP methyl ester carboxylesterase